MHPPVLAPEIAWLYGLQHFGVKLGLESIRALLRELGHPETAYPSILVAGTNGKGSVSALLHSMLQAAGVHTGLFTSPHLVHPAERIRIGRADIDPADLARRLGRMRAAIEAARAGGRLAVQPSFFEVITATALLAFAEAGVRSAVLEVGLGGRLDATNAVDADVSVVVSVDLDHMESLGPTIEKIAAEKAGIVKAGKPVVSGVVRQQALSVLHRVCRERKARLIDARTAVRLEAAPGEALCFGTADRTYPDLRLGLAGRHQIDNARVALCALEAFAGRAGFRPSAEAVRHGLAEVRWPGRLQWIEPPGGPALLLDGAHNPSGARSLAGYLSALRREPPVLLFGAMRDKPADEILALIGPRVHAAVLTRPPVARAAEPAELAPVASRFVSTVEVHTEPATGLARAREMAGSERFVLVTGSLYLIGSVLAALGDPEAPGPVAS